MAMIDCKVIETYMVHCPAPAAPAHPRNALRTCCTEIDLFPWILIASYDDTRCISIQQE
jgi:hypothetical protein